MYEPCYETLHDFKILFNVKYRTVTTMLLVTLLQ